MALVQLPSTPEIHGPVGAGACSAPALPHSSCLGPGPALGPRDAHPTACSCLPGTNTSGVWSVWRVTSVQSQRQGVVCSCIRTSGCGVQPSGRQADRRVGSRWRWLQAQPDPRAHSAVSALRMWPVFPGSTSGGTSPPEEASLQQLQTSRLAGNAVGSHFPRVPGGALALVPTARGGQGAQSQGPGVHEPAPLWTLPGQQHVDPPSGASAGAAGCRAWGPLFQTPHSWGPPMLLPSLS